MCHRKTILFLLNRECRFLPPFISMIDALAGKYDLKIISHETPGSLSDLSERYKGANVEFLLPGYVPESRSLRHRATRRVKHCLGLKSLFQTEAEMLLASTDYDLLWVIHEKTLLQFGRALKGRKYVVSLYELNDHDRHFLDKLSAPLQNASEVIVPEYNRACILRVWEGLSDTPTVIPNKPLRHPGKRFIANPYADMFRGKKVILYQGYIQKSRNIDTLCEACKDMTGYSLVIMGGGDQEYIGALKAKYPHVIHIPFVTPPAHLEITSHAYIGIVKYDFVLLNAIFCAPNKTWEYAGFGIPVLGHDIPGLEYTVGRYHAGICCDMDHIESVRAAIRKIESQYDYYSANALEFYNSFDLPSAINGVVERNL